MSWGKTKQIWSFGFYSSPFLVQNPNFEWCKCPQIQLQRTKYAGKFAPFRGKLVKIEPKFNAFVPVFLPQPPNYLAMLKSKRQPIRKGGCAASKQAAVAHTHTHTHTHAQKEKKSLSFGFQVSFGKESTHTQTCTHTHMYTHSVSFTQTHTISGSRDFDLEISFSCSLESMYAHLFYFSSSLSLSRYSQSEHALSLCSVIFALCALSFAFTFAITGSLPLLESIVLLCTLQSIPFKVTSTKTLSKARKLESLFCNILVM